MKRNFRKRLYEIIDLSGSGDIASKTYDIFMIITIFVSIIPLAFKEQYRLFVLIDKISAAIFIFDYLARLLTADYKFNRNHAVSFLKYPFTPMAIIDLVSILPSITVLNSGLKLFKIFRLFRCFRIFKAVRYSKSISIILSVCKQQKDALIAVCMIAVAYILVSALIILNVEPQSFGNYFDAVYWATVSLTTVGYGDIYPVTTLGRIITMISSIFGIAIVAMPAGIITAGFMDQLNKD